jgi:A nuclease of the HNH/ENDO VII superfamily with conserved WHH
MLCAVLGCSAANAVAPGEAGQDRVSNGQHAVETAAALTLAKYLGAVAGVVGGELGAGATAITKGAPKAYSVAFEATLTENGVGTYAAHFAEANEQLLKSMVHPEMANALKGALGQDFEGALISPSGSGRVVGSSPPGWTWHHVPERPGIMQLVPRAQHAPGSAWQPILHPGGEGGMAKWGSRF